MFVFLILVQPCSTTILSLLKLVDITSKLIIYCTWSKVVLYAKLENFIAEDCNFDQIFGFPDVGTRDLGHN
jgi:hypothetical protein